LKPKVLVILNRLVIGGQTLDTIPLLYHLEDDFDILVLYGCKEKDEKEADFLFKKFGGLNLTPMLHFRRSLNIYRDVLAFFSILGTIRKFKPDVVHTHGLKSGLMGRIAARINAVPCIFHTFHGHHFHSYFNPFISKSLVLLERQLGKISTKIIAISSGQKKELAELYKIVPPGKIEVIPLGIDEKLFASIDPGARHYFRDKYFITSDTVSVGIVGRIVQVKNYPLFVKVAAKVISASKQAIKFFVIGDGSEKVYVQEELDKLKISWCDETDIKPQASVIFTSWIHEVSGMLHALDIIMLTSHNEGTPMSLIEAQFCGKPVVATNVGGVKDTFLPGETGFLVMPGDAGDFADKLLILADNKKLRTDMGGKGAIFANENFSKTKEVNSLKLLYQTCTKHNIK